MKEFNEMTVTDMTDINGGAIPWAVIASGAKAAGAVVGCGAGGIVVGAGAVVLTYYGLKWILG